MRKNLLLETSNLMFQVIKVIILKTEETAFNLMKIIAIIQA